MKVKISAIHLKLLFLSLVLALYDVPALCQDARTEVAGIPINYQESKVPAYSLPDPLVLQNGLQFPIPGSNFLARGGRLSLSGEEVTSMFQSLEDIPHP